MCYNITVIMNKGVALEGNSVLCNNFCVEDSQSQNLKSLEHYKSVLKSLERSYSKTQSIDNTEEEGFINKINQVNGKIIEILNRLGIEQYENGNIEQALKYYNDILFYDFNNWEFYSERGKHFRELGEYALSVLFLEKALEYNPQYSNLYWFIGEIYLKEMDKPIEALNYFKKYIDIVPPDAEAFYIIGKLYKKCDEDDFIKEQIEFFQKAVKINPNHKDAIRDLALAYSMAGEHEKSFEYFYKLFELGATMDNYFSYSTRKLKLKDFEEGFKYYECRFLLSEPTQYPEINKPRWSGENISDKTLLVQFEQGYGDSIQFARYLEQVKPLAKKIIFRTRYNLFKLFHDNLEGIELVGQTTPIEILDFDYHIPLLSLPFCLNTTVENIPYKEGYLNANKEKTEEFKQKFFDNNCFKIGIAWCGSEDGVHQRDIPLDVFYPLTKLKNMKVYSFQKDYGEEQIDLVPKGTNIIDISIHLKDFSDTAAAMENMDLIITSDNGNVHLAGAMGKRAFLLLNKHSEWRWFYDEEKTSWYDSVKIFKKQNESDNWNTLINRVIDEINCK